MFPVGQFATDVQSTAFELIHQYGDDAEVVAVMRAAELAALGDEEGLATWDQIIACISALGGDEASRSNPS